MVKASIKSIYHRAINWRHKLREKKFSSFNEALEFCKKNGDLGHNDKARCSAKFQALNKYMNDIYSFNVFRSPETPLFLYCYKLYKNTADSSNIIPQIVNFGGGCGEAMFNLASLLGDAILQKCSVIECQQMVDESKKWEFCKALRFYQEIDDLPSQPVDILFSSGTLPYLPDPMSTIVKMASIKALIVAFTRNNFQEKSYISVHKSLGWGPMDSLGKQKLVATYTPITYLNEKELISIFESKGYKLAYSDEGDRSGCSNPGSQPKDLVFMYNE